MGRKTVVRLTVSGARTVAGLAPADRRYRRGDGSGAGRHRAQSVCWRSTSSKPSSTKRAFSNASAIWSRHRPQRRRSRRCQRRRRARPPMPHPARSSSYPIATTTRPFSATSMSSGSRRTSRWSPEDLHQLGHPEHILDDGGAILIALKDGEPVGTAALVRMDGGRFELAKMAVGAHGARAGHRQDPGRSRHCRGAAAAGQGALSGKQSRPDRGDQALLQAGLRRGRSRPLPPMPAAISRWPWRWDKGILATKSTKSGASQRAAKRSYQALPLRLIFRTFRVFRR